MHRTGINEKVENTIKSTKRRKQEITTVQQENREVDV